MSRLLIVPTVAPEAASPCEWAAEPAEAGPGRPLRQAIPLDGTWQAAQGPMDEMPGELKHAAAI